MSVTDRFKLSRRAAVVGIAAQSLIGLAGAFQPARAVAPMLGVMRPQIYRFKLGAFEVTNILDGVVQRPGPHPIFGQNQPEAAVQELARAHRLPATQLENPYTVTLVNTGKELIVFDTGNGEARRDKGLGNLRSLLPLAGYTPEQIDIVVITHGHPDHIGGLMEKGKPAFPNARYVFGAVEFDYWRAGKEIPERRAKNREQFMTVAVPFAEQTTFLWPGQDVVTGI